MTISVSNCNFHRLCYYDFTLIYTSYSVTKSLLHWTCISSRGVAQKEGGYWCSGSGQNSPRRKNDYFQWIEINILRSKNFKLKRDIERNSTKIVLLLCVKGGHCDCSSPGVRNLPTSLTPWTLNVFQRQKFATCTQRQLVNGKRRCCSTNRNRLLWTFGCS
jgi:hypothetical protein